MTKSVDEQNVRQAPKGRLPNVGGRSEKSVATLLTAPGQLVMLFIVLFPAALAIYLGFTAWSPTSGSDVWHAYEYWHWFDGYWEALNDGTFWSALWRTVLFTVVAVGMEFVIGFGLAMLFLKQFPGRGVLTLFFLLPMMVVPAVSGFVFYMIFQVEGPLNQFLSHRARPGRHDPLAREPEPRALVGDGRRHLAVDAPDVPDPPLRARRAARGSDEPGTDSRRQLLAPVSLPDPADDEADHPDRAHHPGDRGLQGLRRTVPPHAGWAGRRLDDDLRSGCTARSSSTPAGASAVQPHSSS